VVETKKNTHICISNILQEFFFNLFFFFCYNCWHTCCKVYRIYRQKTQFTELMKGCDRILLYPKLKNEKDILLLL